MEHVGVIGKCRACQMNTQEESQVYIFATMNLAQIFQEATSLPIHVNDGLPGVLCISCYNRLLEAYNFRKMCAAAAIEFHQMLSDASDDPPEEKYRPPEILMETKMDPDDVAMAFNFSLEKKFEPCETIDPLTATKADPDGGPMTSRSRYQKRSLSDESYDPHLSVKQEKTRRRKKHKQSNETCAKNFSCALCNRRFLNKLGIEAHMRRVHQGLKKGCICSICNKELANGRTLTRHMAAKHGIKSNFSCEIFNCFAQFQTEERYLAHKKKCHDPSKTKSTTDSPSKSLDHICLECGQGFRTQGGLGRHIYTHKMRDPSMQVEMKKNPENWRNSNLRGVRPTITCELCERKFFKKIGLEVHMRIVHQGLKKGCVCPVCGKELSRQDSLKWHMARKHGIKDKFSCEFPECFKQFETEESLILHTNRAHDPDNPRPKSRQHICETCGKVFPSPAGLKKHKYTHTGLASRPFTCDLCPKRFVTKNNLEIHKMRHDGVKNHVCTICGLGKVTSRELKIHMNYHTREKLFECPLCPLKTTSRENMKRHVKVVHQGIKAYPCPHCERTFGKAETLKHHVMTHTGEKPHACNICGKRFIQPTAMQTHMKTHLRPK